MFDVRPGLYVAALDILESFVYGLFILRGQGVLYVNNLFWFNDDLVANLHDLNKITGGLIATMPRSYHVIQAPCDRGDPAASGTGASGTN